MRAVKGLLALAILAGMLAPAQVAQATERVFELDFTGPTWIAFKFSVPAGEFDLVAAGIQADVDETDFSSASFSVDNQGRWHASTSAQPCSNIHIHVNAEGSVVDGGAAQSCIGSVGRSSGYSGTGPFQETVGFVIGADSVKGTAYFEVRGAPETVLVGVSHGPALFATDADFGGRRNVGVHAVAEAQLIERGEIAIETQNHLVALFASTGDEGPQVSLSQERLFYGGPGGFQSGRKAYQLAGAAPGRHVFRIDNKSTAGTSAQRVSLLAADVILP